MDAHKNPFRTAQTDRLPFLPTTYSVDEIWKRFESLQHRGVIAGPHGSGKSTLLRELVRRAEDEGMRCRIRRAMRDGRKVTWSVVGVSRADLEIIDGFDLLSWPERALLRCARGKKLIAVAHCEVPGLPLLHRCETSEELLRLLLARLETDYLTQAERSALLLTHNGNIREALRALYDLFATDLLGKQTPKTCDSTTAHILRAPCVLQDSFTTPQ